MSPIDKITEVDALIQAGADEFYCGLSIDGEHFGTTRLSGEIKQYNVSGCAQLEKIALVLHKCNKDLYLVLNCHYWAKEMITKIIKLLDFFREIKIKGLILSSLDLIQQLRCENFKITASSLLEAKSVEAVKLLEKAGARRVILDRQISYQDLKIITSRFPEMEFEVFVFGAGCRNLDCYCQPKIAAMPGRDYVHPCFFESSVFVDKIKKEKLNLKKQKIIAGRLRMPKITCAGCALYVFKKRNVRALKIVGRGYQTTRKVKNIHFIKGAVDILMNTKNRLVYNKKVKSLFKQIYGKNCSKDFCYYPHF